VEEEVLAGPQCCGGTCAQTGHAIPHPHANTMLGVSPEGTVASVTKQLQGLESNVTA
jgi:hypothetical protein